MKQCGGGDGGGEGGGEQEHQRQARVGGVGGGVGGGGGADAAPSQAELARLLAEADKADGPALDAPGVKRRLLGWGRGL